MLCDTCILIEYLRGNKETLAILAKNPKSELALSAITMMELMIGAFNKREVSAIKNAFAGFKII
jgi:predicted nucleic acid-binding protein